MAAGFEDIFIEFSSNFPSEVKEDQLEVVHGSHGKGAVPIHCPVGTALVRSEPGHFISIR